MPLKTKIKVGNISNLSEARYCAGMGVDMLGFKINEAEGRGISLTKFKEITDWISGPEFILELSEELTDQAQEKYKINLIEYPVSKISYLSLSKQPTDFIISLDVEDWKTYHKDLLEHRDQIKYLLVTNLGGKDISKAKLIISELAVDFSVLLAFDIQVNLLEEYLRWPISGLALSGSEETSPGIKDYDHLSSILEKLEVD